MAHFAKLDEKNNVIGVHIVNNDVITVNGVESEQAGIDFLTELYGHRLWKQTSYNKTIRGYFAGVGFKYDTDFDVFIPPIPYPNWKWNYTTLKWEPPVAKPNDIKGYRWNWSELNQEWVSIPLPTE